MRCPHCFQAIHESAETCPHCGMDGTALEVLYSDRERNIALLNDEAGMLRVHDREKVKVWISKFEKEFPQCFLSVSTVALNDDQDLRSYGVWALSSKPVIGAEHKDPSFGVMIIIDVKKKESAIVYGYQHEPYMTDKGCFNAISLAHPHLLDGKYLQALGMMRHGLRKLMRKNKRKAQKMLRRGDIAV